MTSPLCALPIRFPYQQAHALARSPTSSRLPLAKHPRRAAIFAVASRRLPRPKSKAGSSSLPRREHWQIISCAARATSNEVPRSGPQARAQPWVSSPTTWPNTTPTFESRWHASADTCAACGGFQNADDTDLGLGYRRSTQTFVRREP